MPDRTIAVTGATGTQGGAVAHHLLAEGHTVRALTRNPDGARAQQLAQAGAEVRRADLDDRASLDAALEGVGGLFSVQNTWAPGVGPEGEVRQGRALADAAAAAGVGHVVYSSVGGAERDSGVPHFESKWRIEQHLASLDLPVTVLRPVAFMENYLGMRDAVLAGTFPGFGLPPGRRLQLVAADDIGVFAARAFADPAAWAGRALELAGDELTEPDMAATFSRAFGRPVELPARDGSTGEDDMQRERDVMVTWFVEHGYQADIAALRREHPGLTTFEQWVAGLGWSS